MGNVVQQARELAISRWQSFFPFDLEQSQWDSLFAEFNHRDILQSITFTRSTSNRAPAVIYDRFMASLKRLNEERNPSWPPLDVQPKQ